MNICTRSGCGANFIPTRNSKGLFCSRRCASIVNNQKYPKRKRHEKRFYNCSLCGKEKAGSSSKYCQNCYNQTRHDQFIDRWLNGQESGVVGKEGISIHIRRWLLTKAKNRCEKCGWDKVNPATGKVPVQINHINGKWDDNRPENLEILCPNCHSLTYNFGGLNRGRGRSGRYTKI